VLAVHARIIATTPPVARDRALLDTRMRPSYLREVSEARLLWLVRRYPHPSALARHVRDAGVFAGLGRLEARGLLIRQRGQYRLTRRGREELDVTQLLTRLLARTERARR
jgi:hypothetical protein